MSKRHEVVGPVARARRRFWMSAAVVSATLVSLVALAAPAQAHNYLISSTPSSGETLTTLPAKFVITTNDLLLNISGNGAGFALQVTDAAGRYYGDGCIAITGPAMTMPAALGAAGKYTLTWQVVSTDGHTVSDSFPFVWQPPAGFTARAGSSAAPDCHGKNPATAQSSHGTSTPRTVANGTLDAVLWIGGALVAIAIAVVLTLVLTGRKRRSPEDDDPDPDGE